MKGNYVLEVNGLKKVYDGRTVVDNVSFCIGEGEVLGFLGPNGAGKTTTIRMILALIHPNSGGVKICGYDNKTEFIDSIKNVGAIVETPKFYEGLSGYMNLKLIANLHPEVSKERIEEVIQIVGLKDRIKDKVKKYSLGMKQRLGIGRALLHSPKLIILDEPTNGLDPKGIREIRELIGKLASTEKVSFMISSHLLSEVEQMCSSVLIINQGKILKAGLVKDLVKDDKNLEDFFIEITEGAEENV
ncbi:MAG: ABC transporter ATP-binding protein [Clostridiaceae bacterium]|nr:ABC transporter ATP-binding protein [Clostridiaceae bacterium]